MVLPQPKIHQVVGSDVRPYDLMQAQLGNKALLDKLAGLPVLDGALLEDIELDYSAVNLVEHKLGRRYRGFIVVRRQVPPSEFQAYKTGTQTLANGTGEDIDFEAESYDYGGNFATGVPGIYTAPVNGLYHFDLDVRWADSLADATLTFASIVIPGGGAAYAQDELVLGAARAVSLRTSITKIALAAGDTACGWTRHNDAAGNKNLAGTSGNLFRGGLVDDGVTEDADWLATANNDPTKFLPLRCSFDHTISLWVF